MTKALTTAAALTPSLRVTVAIVVITLYPEKSLITTVRSPLRVSIHTFGVPLSTMQMTLGIAVWRTFGLIGPALTSGTAFQCVLLGIKNLDS